MDPVYKEARFAPDYRQAAVEQIMAAVYRLRSIAITGLAGMGKSNVVRFFVSHPQVRQRYLGERANEYAFVHVDCAGLIDSDEADILAEVAAQMRHDGLSTSVDPFPQDARGIRHALKEQILGIDPDLNVVLVLDYFDHAAATLKPSFFDYFFHLRNARPRGNLVYIFVTRRPMGHLGELEELLDDGCTIAPLGRQDALDSIRRDETRMGCVFEPAQREQLIACTGGHAGFLKNAAELLHSGQIDAHRPARELARQLLYSPKVENLCRELWNDLTPAEQSILLHVARDPSHLPTGGTDVAYLERSGVLTRDEQRPGKAIFCPLFETFVAQRAQAISPAVVRIGAEFPNQARIETPFGEKQVELSPKLFALLRAFAEARDRHVLTTDTLIARVYGGEAAGVSDAALSQLVKRLRARLNPPVRRMLGDSTYDCIETVREVGYRLNG